MGQKVHPYGFRLGFNKPWRSRWFAKQGYAKLLQEDLELREGLRDRLKSAGVSSIEVDRPGNKLRVTIRTSRPGIIIGRKGAEIEKLKQDRVYKRLNYLASPQGPRVQMEGRGEVVILSSNNYLGLCNDPAVVGAGVLKFFRRKPRSDAADGPA